MGAKLSRAVALLVLGLALLLPGCLGNDAASTAASPSEGSTSDAAGGHAVGTLRVGLEELEGVFVEGFQLQLGIDTAGDGEERTYTWEQLVNDEQLQWPEGVTPQDIEWWYQGVLVMELPAGEVTVTGKLDLGMEPPGTPCSRDFLLEEGATLEVVVRLTDPDRGCPVAGSDA